MKLSEISYGTDSDKYRVLHSLKLIGIGGLVELAVEEYGYKLKLEYARKCDLCYDIRSYLVLDQDMDLPGLQPISRYKFI